MTSPVPPSSTRTNQKSRLYYEFEEYGDRLYKPASFGTRLHGRVDQADEGHSESPAFSYKHYALSVVLYSWDPYDPSYLDAFLHACGSETVRAMLSMWSPVAATQFECEGGSEPKEPYHLRWSMTSDQYRKPPPDPESWGAAQDYISNLAEDHGMRAVSHQRWREAEDKHMKIRQMEAMKEMRSYVTDEEYQSSTRKSLREGKNPSVTRAESRFRKFVDKSVKSKPWS